MPDNLFDGIPADLPQEWLQTLFSGDRGFRVERIVSRGHASPEGFWYQQDEEEWVLLLSGSAELEYQSPPRRVALKPGDAIAIPAGCRHRVSRTAPDQDSVWLAIFYKK
ncbi:phosphoribosylaminoimidazole carboxylase [Chromobacterium sp. ATCC 53434]|uniref:cupin domain-containing protein n=1 Tax=Chromobacterium TaxID=535 RepID=UPI000C770438|nr:cupin domain-containing protein [Chromobacterium sp. ATCC 53434]AUH51542.1 phosphoribosylaminoimidazole carboxylase [Chromobacterium sp. ATCC 53434]